MRWKNESLRPKIIDDYTHSIDIIIDAYDEGYIDWNVFQKVIDKIERNWNSNRMFEPVKDENIPLKDRKLRGICRKR